MQVNIISPTFSSIQFTLLLFTRFTLPFTIFGQWNESFLIVCFLSRIQMKTPNGMMFYVKRVSFRRRRRESPKMISLKWWNRPLRTSKSRVINCFEWIDHTDVTFEIVGEKELSELDLDGLDELEDSEDEAVLLEYRNRRIAEMRALAEKSKFGFVREISGQDYIEEVNKAGEGIHVVLHLWVQCCFTFEMLNKKINFCQFRIQKPRYKQGIQLCALINQFMADLATRFPYTKFLKAISTTCIPNFPEKNLPSIFIYYEGNIKKQIIGPVELRGEKLTAAGKWSVMLNVQCVVKYDA